MVATDVNKHRACVGAPLVVLALFASSVCVTAQLRVLADPQPQQVLSGAGRRISLLVSNTTDKTATAEVRARLHQTSFATTVRLGEAPWKMLQVLPGQTVVESAALDFPNVEAQTRFVIQWIAGSNQILGRTEVWVYPDNLLQQLNPLIGVKALGVLDPQNQLKPLLKLMGVQFADLHEVGMESFDGELAIVGPFASNEQMRDGLPNQIETISKKGVAVVWIQPPQAVRDKIEPSFYCVPSIRHATIIVQAPLLMNLSENPQSQLNLVYFARLALNPEPVRLPHVSKEP